MELQECRYCGLVQRVEDPPPGSRPVCARCDSELDRRKPNSVERTFCYALAALILYFPANIYPIVSVDYLGHHNATTIWDGVHGLFETGNWGVGALVFMTSIFTPGLKLLSLFLLSITAHKPGREKERLILYKIVEFVNPWNMLEIFMLSFLVGVVKFGEAATVIPGAGAIAFGGVVALTIMASESFDPRLVWDAEEARA